MGGRFRQSPKYAVNQARVIWPRLAYRNAKARLLQPQPTRSPSRRNRQGRVVSNHIHWASDLVVEVKPKTRDV